MEIERKFLADALPIGLNRCEMFPIAQGYISTDPVLRLRRYGAEYFFTFKGSGLLAREEFEYPLTGAQFERLWKKTEGSEILKDRYIVPLGNGLTAELDIFRGRLSGLATVEVEFASVESAEAFSPPAWFGEDVTSDARFSNNYLSANLPPYTGPLLTDICELR